MARLQFPRKLKPLFEPAPYKVLYGGRGGTKSWGIGRALLLKGRQQPLIIFCARETQTSIRDSVHRLLANQVIALGLTKFYTVLQRTIVGPWVEVDDGNGGTKTIRTEFIFAGLSSLTVDSIKSFEGADICWVEEAQSITRRSWKILLPTIRKHGSEVWISFNPDLDTDDTYVRFVENPPPGTIKIPLSYRDNPWLSDKFIHDMEHLRRTNPLEFENVYEGKPRAAAEGAIYTPEVTALANSTRICNAPVDPMLQVHTIWDLGFNDATAIIFVQRHLSELRIVDYVEERLLNMADYAQILDRKGYRYGTDWLPWDGAEGKFKLLGEGVSPEAMLRKMGRTVAIVPQADVEIGIKRARMIFPRCYFDKDKTVRLRECLKRYRRTIPTTTGEPSTPLHDEFSHGADAFRYLAMVADKLVESGKARNTPINYPKRAYA